MDDYSIRRTKGDIAEAICKNHLSAMGMKVEYAGVEHFAREFANRFRKEDTDETSEGKIHKYIGQLPDMLAGNSNYGYYFVEVKLRTNISIELFEKELLWNYRNIIFKEYDAKLFPNVLPADWNSSSKPSQATLIEFHKNIKANEISFAKIVLPILFYILIKNDSDDERKPAFTLYLLYFDQYKGNFFLHEAGTDAIGIEDAAFNGFLSSFNEHFLKTVVPVLNTLFSANIKLPQVPSTTSTVLQLNEGTLAYLCFVKAQELKKPKRHGVYFADLLADREVANRLSNKNLIVDKFSLKSEMEREGISTVQTTVTIDDQLVELTIKEFQNDFYFYMR